MPVLQHTVQLYPWDSLQSGPQAVVGVMELPVSCPKHTHRKNNFTLDTFIYFFSNTNDLGGTLSSPLVWVSVFSYCRISIWLSRTSRSSENCFTRSSCLQRNSDTSFTHTVSARRTELEQTHHQEIHSFTKSYESHVVNCSMILMGDISRKTNNGIKTPSLRWCVEAESCPACGAPVAKQCSWS